MDVSVLSDPPRPVEDLVFILFLIQFGWVSYLREQRNEMIKLCCVVYAKAHSGSRPGLTGRLSLHQALLSDLSAPPA